MNQAINIYCDESCHLERDGHGVMVLGAVWCPADQTRQIAQRIREIKSAHGMAPEFELKWNKVSPAKIELYKSIIDYFFDDDDLRFRAVIIPDKSKLRHADFGQDHDTWYYKMMFTLLEPLLAPSASHYIYLDQKDTRSAEKVKGLHDVLCSSLRDFNRKIVERVQTVRSHEVQQIQMADLLIGAVCYANRGLTGSSAKLDLISRIRQRSRYTLTRTTLLQEQKTNLFIWTPREPQ